MELTDLSVAECSTADVLLLADGAALETGADLLGLGADLVGLAAATGDEFSVGTDADTDILHKPQNKLGTRGFHNMGLRSS